MHLAVLMTNTDESDFAQAHPKDGEKFAQLIHMVRPDWTITSYTVKDGVFPNNINDYDGFMITGSPASVHDDAPWVGQLLDIIRAVYVAKIPMFGACFGHQAIALALGGTVGQNPNGWVFGLTQTQIAARARWTQQLPDTFSQYAAHIEQVTKLPKRAKVLTTSPACPVAGFQIDNAVCTTQNHPEMTADFMAALVAEYAEKLPVDVAKIAKNSLSGRADTLAYADSIAQFFEATSTH
jgi:GMP synthase-like glutamine amidotransferase